MKLLTLLIALGFTHAANASVIAIIDSGTDLNHKELTNKKWVNAKDIDDAVDNDDNGYIDDVNGWNFADNNNKLFEKQYLGTFSPDVYKFFEVQTRLLKGEGTTADREWMTAARSNTKLISELGVFGNFVHGTHVAGITAKNADAAQIMVLKIIPTKSPLAGGGKHNSLGVNYAYSQILAAKGRDGLIKAGLKLLASQQAKTLAPIGTYVGKKNARIANCSFGTSTEAAKGVLKPILKIALGHEATAEELETYAKFFVAEITKTSQVLFTTAPKTLFVIAAGNDGMDNDVFPTSPANIKLQNTITVAATLGYNKIASFSNYGATMVDVAAPGVGILSTIPGNEYLTVSGTSQASPFVANVAGLAVDANPNLTNADLKKLLMETVDQKAFLKGKVVSGGIVNVNRAVMAATMSKSMPLLDAIHSARLQVTDIETGMSDKMNLSGYEGYVIPMPSLFQ
jgi:subtilisin family serine protease